MPERHPSLGTTVVPSRGKVGRNWFRVGTLENPNPSSSEEVKQVIRRLQVPTKQGGIDSLARDRQAARARFAPFCASLMGEAIEAFIANHPERRDENFPLRAMAPTGSEMGRTRTMEEWGKVFTTAAEHHPRLVTFMTDLILPSAIERASEGSEGSGLAELMNEAKEEIPAGQGNPWRVAVCGWGQGGGEVSTLWNVFLKSAFRGPGSSLQYTSGVVQSITDYDEAHRLLSTEHPGRTIFLPVSEIDTGLIEAMASARANVECFVPVGLIHDAIAEPMIKVVLDGKATTLKTGAQRGDGNLIGTVRVMAQTLFEKWVFDDLGRAVEDAFKISPRATKERLGPLMTALYLETPTTWGNEDSWHARVGEAIFPFIQEDLEAMTAEQPEMTDDQRVDLREEVGRILAERSGSSSDFSREAQRPPWIQN